jgi:uncharacterized protein
VPTIVQRELTKWLARDVGDDKADQGRAFSLLCKIAPGDTGIAWAAAGMFSIHTLAAADAIVDASTRAQNADLLACDAHVEGLLGIRLIPRMAG